MAAEIVSIDQRKGRGIEQLSSEVDHAIRLAQLLRAQTDLLVLANDNAIPVAERQKLRMAAEIAGEVRLR